MQVRLHAGTGFLALDVTLCRLGFSFGRRLFIVVALLTSVCTRRLSIMARVDAGLYRVIVRVSRDHLDSFDLFAVRTVLVVHVALGIRPLVNLTRQRNAANPEGCGGDHD